MHKVRHWLLLKIARMPRVFICGIGIFVSLALMLASVAAVAWLDQSRTAQRHDAALQLMQKVTAEGSGLLDRLARKGRLNCSDQGLVDLNAELLGSRYLREIGVLDENRQLICSTALGRLSVPIKDDYPVHVSRSGLELLTNVPLTMAGRKVAATIIQRPPVNVVVSPYATDDLYASADAVWLRTTDGLFLLNANGIEARALPAMQARAGRLEGSSLSRQGLGYERVSMAPGQDVVLQTRRSLPAIVQGNALLPVLLAGSLLIAGLVIGTVTPFVYRLGSLRNRIGLLCDEAHLALVYQPVFDLATLRPVGCEVLARLREGETTWAPDRMIPAIRGAGLQRRFDHAVARKAIRELAAHLPAWEGRFGIALNCFPESIEPDVLIPLLEQALRATGRDDLEVCIEITEHSLSSELIPEVQRLKARGFLIAVDDFGTGYSNLRSVTQLSPDLLKIDGSFVYELEDATVRSNLIPEIVNIAHAVEAQTVAEGIEKMEQVQLLLAAGVRYGQGYALARPLGIEAFVDRVAVTGRTDPEA